MTLLERIERPIRFNALKHGLWKQEGFNDVDEYVIATLSRMTAYELLVTISAALEDEK